MTVALSHIARYDSFVNGSRKRPAPDDGPAPKTRKVEVESLADIKEVLACLGSSG